MTLNEMRVAFGHYAKWIMGFMFVAMVVTTFSWNGLGKGNSGSQAAASQQNPDEVVATVDGEKVTRQQFNDLMQRAQQQMGGGSLPLMERPFFRTYAMQQVMNTYETLAAAEKLGIKITDDDIQAQREKDLKAQNARKVLGLSEKASLADIDAALQQSNNSIDHILPESAMRIEATMDKLQDKLRKGVVVTEQNTRDSYTQYHTRHILIDNQKRSDVQAQARGKEVIAKLQAPGADFAALAKQYSEDFGTKDKGGDDGWIDDSTHYVPEFKTAAFALKPGQITTDLVKSTSYGYFIIKLDAVRNNLPKDFDAKKADYIAKYAKSKQDEAIQKFGTDLQAAQHNIVMIDPQLKADKEFTDAQRLQPPDPVKQTPMFNQAIADYEKAIKTSTSGQDKAMMYIQIASANQSLKNTAAEIAAYEAALKANGTDDPNLLNTLGGLYKDQKDNVKAIDAFQRASAAAWTDEGMHTSLEKNFDDLGRKDLGDKERKWVADYDLAHPKPKSPAMSLGGPGGQPITVSPSGGNVTAHPVTVSTAPAKDSATPPTVTVKPASGKPATTPVKPAQ